MGVDLRESATLMARAGGEREAAQGTSYGIGAGFIHKFQTAIEKNAPEAVDELSPCKPV
jgi:hypothetical protein